MELGRRGGWNLSRGTNYSLYSLLRGNINRTDLVEGLTQVVTEMAEAIMFIAGIPDSGPGGTVSLTTNHASRRMETCTGEIAQSVRHLYRQHGDLNSIPTPRQMC